MHIRILEARDIPGVVDVASRAFLDDELFRFLAPRGRLYPTSWRKYVAARIRARLVQRASWGIVAVPSAEPADHDRILGYAFYDRTVGPESAPQLAIVAAAAAIWPLELTEDEEVRARRDALAYDPWSNNHEGWMDSLNRALLQIEERVGELVRANPAVDYRAVAQMRKSDIDEETLAPLRAGVTHWHLGVCAVDPAVQRQGVGTALVEWGIKMAEHESREKGFSIPVCLTASVMGMGLYRKLGFKIVDWVGLDVAGDSVNEGGAAMVWDSRSTWVTKAPEGTPLNKGRPVEVVWTERALGKLKSKPS